jgi:hypothetical protein
MATTSAATTPFTNSAQSAAINPTAKIEFEELSYFHRLRKLENAFPALKPFLEKVNNVDVGRQIVQDFYQQKHELARGRCYCLELKEDHVSIIDGYPNGFGSPQALRTYLENHPAESSRQRNRRRLFILEDMESNYVDALDYHLGVDPLVFSGQMNTWNFTDSIPRTAITLVGKPVIYSAIL